MAVLSKRYNIKEYIHQSIVEDRDIILKRFKLQCYSAALLLTDELTYGHKV